MNDIKRIFCLFGDLGLGLIYGLVLGGLVYGGFLLVLMKLVGGSAAQTASFFAGAGVCVGVIAAKVWHGQKAFDKEQAAGEKS